MSLGASKRGEVAVPCVWLCAVICAKVFLFNEMRVRKAQKESEYATVPMGIGFGRE
jgi:hypothetical protein